MAAAPTRPGLLLRGDPRHGVDRHAQALAARLDRVRPVAIDRVHLHFCDRLWGDSPEAAAALVEQVAAARRVAVTLHDVPQPSDGTALPRRVAAYRRVAAVARGVAVSSRHEATLLARHTEPGLAPLVVPLPIDPLAAPQPGPVDDDVALLGFVYPGKGHAEVLAALGSLADPPPLTVLGGAAPGHDAEVAVLAAQAAAAGVPLAVTGYLEDADQRRRILRAGVPLAAHRHVSASASITAWIAAGRRPLVPADPYTREMAALRPGTVTLYEPGELLPAIARARQDPASTWLGADAVLAPGLRETTAAYLAWWDGLPW
jgi:hypothetical protein